MRKRKIEGKVLTGSRTTEKQREGREKGAVISIKR